MKNSRIIFFLLIGLLLGTFSCRDDEDRIIEITQPSNGAMFEGSVSGKVTNDRDHPISGVTISLQGISTLTDKNGLYSFSNVNLPENQKAIVKVAHPNYLETSRAFTTTQNRSIVNFEVISTEGFVDFFNSTDEADLEAFSLTSELVTTIKIPADAYVFDGTNIPYQGIVKASANFIDPSDRSRINSIPGDLGGIDANGTEVQLGSYSMLSVHLQSLNGEKLNLAEGIEASVKFALPEEFASNAPSTIPLWHYDVEAATWREEGMASLSSDGKFYEGTVSHFSFWNCDASFPVVELSGRVVNENDSPQTNLTVRITILNSGLTSFGQTDSNGEFEGKIPSGERLKLEYYRNFECVEFIDEVEIGPFNDDIILEDYILSYPDASYNLLTGRLLNCQGLPSSNTFLQVHYGTGLFNVIPDNNGNFNIEVPDCWESLILNAYDFEENFTSTSLFFLGGLIEDTYISDILLCTNELSFHEFNYEGNTYRQDGFYMSMLNNTYTINNFLDSLTSPEINSWFRLSNSQPELEVGNYPNSLMEVSFISNQYFQRLKCTSNVDSCSLEINIESIEDIGGQIRGSYSGTVIDIDSPELREISGTFSALRLN